MLQIKNICKEYKTGNLVQQALNNVSFNLRDSEFVAILGPSGSGKTTLLNIIGGLDRYDSGNLIINEISTKDYKDRDWDSYRNHTIGFVFQSYNLIPHQTILSNVELALTISGVSKTERKKKALEALRQVGLFEQAHKKPNQLSGGQMQRVAIARALVNDPDILLADEPTGALDSDTSIQVMELLKEVAKDRLVVMVTHNPELAQNYATRIINLKDGKICSDTNPYFVEEEKSKKAKHKNMGKTSMSLLTSLALSFNNLRTKRGRTILTSFAGSIGIIGIALILSLSNGVDSYIKSVEEDTLSEYPLQIQSTGFDMTSMFANTMDDTKEEKTADIGVTDILTNMFSKIGSNDLTSLKQYLESDECKIKEYAKAIEYSYSITPQIYSSDIENLRRVNPDSSFKSLGIGSSAISNSMMSSMMSTDMFMQMPTNTNLFKSQYDMRAGHWPTSYNECVLVLTPSGNVSDFLLYTLGLRDSEELEKMIEEFSKEEEVKIPEDIGDYSYEDILGITFKLIKNTDYYEYDKEFKIWRDKSENTKYMKEVVKKGENLKIVGIVQPKEGGTASMLQTGIYYPASLTDYLIQEATDSDIVKKQLKTKDINVFTNKRFDAKDDNSFDMQSLIEIDTAVMKSAFKVDNSKVNVDFSGLSKKIDADSFPPLDLNMVLKNLKFQVSEEQTQALVKEILKGYGEYVVKNNLTDMTKFEEYFAEYLQSVEAKAILTKNLTQIMQSQNLEQQISKIMENYMKSVMASVSKTLEKEVTKSMTKLSSSMANAISIDEKAFAKAFRIKMDEKELAELFASMMTREENTYENNLKKLGYANFEEPNRISIYPKNFENKELILNALDEYNKKMEEENQQDKVISYTDIVGTLMSSVTTIVDVVSYVLVAFVAISLVVSSIMIGVITYISVLERNKEIGILRAIGASKRNVAQVFNAETFIIGLLAGLIGIGVTLLLLIPTNQIIHNIAGQNNINATLPFMAGIILIILSTVLTLIGGIIPSKKAAKADPVTALRSE